MSDDFLARIKGFQGTFVVHSNTNPYAAAAAMGMMSSRSQEAGTFFRPSDSFVPTVDNLVAEEINISPSPDQIEVDFKGNWIAYLRKEGLPACGLAYNDSLTPEQNTLRFLNANFRRIPSVKPRAVRESRELYIPLKYVQDYKKLVALIIAGSDLRPYLSRDIVKKKRSDKTDGLLTAWGIHHLHFRRDGTDQILFCTITDTDVFVIQAFSHKAEYLWVNTQLIQIVHDNWPELILHGKHSGLRPEAMTPLRRATLRSYHANFPVSVKDGTVYLPPAGGTMASGDSLYDWVNCRKIFSELASWERGVTQNAAAIRTALQLPPSVKLVVRMAFDGRNCCFYEPTRMTRFGVMAS